MTNNYKRNGTTLFTALNVLDGAVLGRLIRGPPFSRRSLLVSADKGAADHYIFVVRIGDEASARSLSKRSFQNAVLSFICLSSGYLPDYSAAARLM